MSGNHEIEYQIRCSIFYPLRYNIYMTFLSTEAYIFLYHCSPLDNPHCNLRSNPRTTYWFNLWSVLWWIAGTCQVLNIRDTTPHINHYPEIHFLIYFSWQLTFDFPLVSSDMCPNIYYRYEPQMSHMWMNFDIWLQICVGNVSTLNKHLYHAASGKETKCINCTWWSVGAWIW